MTGLPKPKPYDESSVTKFEMTISDRLAAVSDIQEITRDVIIKFNGQELTLGAFLKACFPLLDEIKVHAQSNKMLGVNDFGKKSDYLMPPKIK